MARGDLLKKLFRSYKGGDSSTFLETAIEIIDDERKKHHISLANELYRIIETDTSYAQPMLLRQFDFEPIPKDADRSLPLIEIRRPDRYFSDVVLADEQKECLRSFFDEFRHWDVLEANALTPSHKLLFCGPPGCGKTATAEAIACELGLPILYVNFDAVVSSLLGETAANLRKVFDYASKGSWVLFFDEFDAIGRSRDDASEHGELKRVVTTFLQILDNFKGRTVVIAATNFEQSLDPALWRRFDEIIRFEKPTLEQTEALMRLRLRHYSYPNNLIPKVSKQLSNMSFAEVERICLSILKRLALQGKKSIIEDDFVIAVKHQEIRKQALEKSLASGAPLVDKAE